jgi:hypothetical protein
MQFEDYLLRFNKNRGTVGSVEYNLHKTIYNNVEKIEKHNNDARFGWKLAINKFTDMNEAEMNAYKGYNKNLGYFKREAVSSNEIRKSYNLSALPKSVDWRTKKNVISPVKSQGGCGSCWAFSATESIESAVAIGTGKLLTLSPQQIVVPKTLSTVEELVDATDQLLNLHLIILLQLEELLQKKTGLISKRMEPVQLLILLLLLESKDSSKSTATLMNP